MSIKFTSVNGKKAFVGIENAKEMTTINVFAHQDTYGSLHLPALIIAGCFVAVAIVLSTVLILQHLRSYTNPAEQKWIVAVLFMVPFYAAESIISLWNSKFSLACDILRNCYEAFALYSFGSYLVACLGGERRVMELLENESRKELNKRLLQGADEESGMQKRSLRSFFTRPSVLGEHLLIIIKFGIVQYMILKAVCAFLAFVLEIFGVYGDGEFNWNHGYPYMAIVLNFSQMWALYCLVQFYNVTHERLLPIKPLAKFISFKAIVFVTWWQGVGIALLCTLGVLPKQGKFQTGLQDFLICIEMATAAVAHMHVFSAEPYHLFLPASEYGRVTTETTIATVKVEKSGKEKPATLEQTETRIEAPGTSVKESVQDIVVEGGQHIVKDVVLTINQAIGPVEKGMTKIQETIQHISVGPNEKKEETTVEVKQEVGNENTRSR